VGIILKATGIASRLRPFVRFGACGGEIHATRLFNVKGIEEKELS
jgi:hypothetical protein